MREPMPSYTEGQLEDLVMIRHVEASPKGRLAARCWDCDCVGDSPVGVPMSQGFFERHKGHNMKLTYFAT